MKLIYDKIVSQTIIVYDKIWMILLQVCLMSQSWNNVANMHELATCSVHNQLRLPVSTVHIIISMFDVTIIG